MVVAERSQGQCRRCVLVRGAVHIMPETASVVPLASICAGAGLSPIEPAD
jgi:hypothetical protein